MRFLPLVLPVCYIGKNPILIRASPILSIGVYSPDSAASPFVLERRTKVALSAAHIADTGEPASEHRGSTDPVGGGTISQQKRPPNQPADLTPCTMRLGDVRQPDTLNTDSTPSTESTTAYGQINDGTVLNVVASPTTTHGASSSIVGMSSPSVVVPILGEAVVDPTSTFSMTTETARVTPSVSLAGNDGSRYEDTLPGRPPKPATTTRAETECSQKRGTASKFRRQAPGDPSCGPDGPAPDAYDTSPSGGPPAHEHPPDGHPHTPSESPCSSSTATGTNTSRAASTSNPVPSNRLPSLPPLLQWFQFALVMFLAVAVWVCIRWVRRKRARPRLECCCHADVPGVFDGSGRTCGRGSWLPERLRKIVAMFVVPGKAAERPTKPFILP